MDHIEKAGMKKKRKKRMFCEICQKFNHVTKNCYKNNQNQVQQMVDLGNDPLVADGEVGARDGEIGII